MIWEIYGMDEKKVHVPLPFCLALKAQLFQRKGLVRNTGIRIKVFLCTTWRKSLFHHTIADSDKIGLISLWWKNVIINFSFKKEEEKQKLTASFYLTLSSPVVRSCF